MNKILPIILVVVLSGCSSDTTIQITGPECDKTLPTERWNNCQASILFGTQSLLFDTGAERYYKGEWKNGLFHGNGNDLGLVQKNNGQIQKLAG